ncbi:MAG: hypothetical protein AAGE96_13395 [Cyanobacteria bacterium P01_G01_bin.19]
MSKQDWATIVYGRSFHLDFRFITIPEDFGDFEMTWISPYILATMHKARNLADCPRWSLFKNDFHCVVGVTCMVRDLIGKLGQDQLEVMTKDELGRPLYVFVGYVTKLERNKSLESFPAYTEACLTSFKPLYQEIEKVWLLRDYDNRQPLRSQYTSLGSTVEIINPVAESGRVLAVNNQQKQPDKTFLWHKSLDRDLQLWLDSALCAESTSVCLNIKGKALSNSPFLNQTATKVERFAIRSRLERVNTENSSKSKQDLASTVGDLRQVSSSLSAKISAKARGDLNLTMEQAAKLTSASQEVIQNLSNWSVKNDSLSDESDLSEKDDFGFKNKTAPLPSRDQDWF